MLLSTEEKMEKKENKRRPRKQSLSHLLTKSDNRRFGQLEEWHNAQKSGITGVLNPPNSKAHEEENVC